MVPDGSLWSNMFKDSTYMVQDGPDLSNKQNEIRIIRLFIDDGTIPIKILESKPVPPLRPQEKCKKLHPGLVPGSVPHWCN